MRKKIIEDRVLKTEEQLLSVPDKAELIKRRNKQLAFLLLAYVPLALILLFVYLDGLSIINRDRFPYQKHETTDEDIENFNLAAPYTCGVFFLLLTLFFVKIYIQTIAPLIKDIRKNKKLLLYIKPEKSEMAFFNKYYISTPIRNKQQVQINKDDFYSITNDSDLIVELAPESQNILRLTNNGNQITFYNTPPK